MKSSDEFVRVGGLELRPSCFGWSTTILWGSLTVYLNKPTANPPRAGHGQTKWEAGILLSTGNMGTAIEPTEDFEEAVSRLVRLLQAGVTEFNQCFYISLG